MSALAPAIGPTSMVEHGWLGGYRREWSVLGAYALLLLLLAVARPAFFHEQFRATGVASAPALVAAMGMTLVIVAREIDISIGSMFSVCAIASGLLAQAGVPMGVMAACTIAGGAAMGAINGALVAAMRLPSIVVTLATMVIFRESLRLARQGAFVNGLPASFQWFGLSQRVGQALIIVVALAVFTAFAWGMRWLAGGRAAYAVGSDREAARLAGIRPARVVFGAFVLMGALTGLAALLASTRFANVDPNSGTGLELEVIAAVVVGGTAIAGGRGTPAGSLIGVALLATIGPALEFLGARPEWERAIQGAIILIAVASDRLERGAD